MEAILIKDIISAIADAAPERWQEGFDNSGLQVGEVNRMCTGVLLCVDATPEIIIEAYDRNCNLIITHHPLIFNPLLTVSGYGRVNHTVYKAIKNDITIYSCHTPIDNAQQYGVSWVMAKTLALQSIEPLEKGRPEGIATGVIGNLPAPITKEELAEKVKAAFGSPLVRCSSLNHLPRTISRVAVGGGACANLIPTAIQEKADAMIVSDCKHNHFLDYLGLIFLIDIGHYEAEKCTKDIFYRIINEKFPNFALYHSEKEINPINYL